MEFLLPVAFFALGAIIASFVGVVVARLNTGESFLTGRSRCDSCNAELHPKVMVPILSYVIYQGRALCCGARIIPITIVTELLLGGLYAGSYLVLGLTLPLFGMAVSLALLLALVLYDLTHQILPTVLLIPFVLASAATGYLASPVDFLRWLLIAGMLGGSLLLINLLSRGRAMGFADAPFTFGLSLLVGKAALSGFIFSFWIGAVIGIIVLLGRPAGSRMGVEVPFAPFLAAGFLLAYFTQWDPFVFVGAFL